MTVPLCVFDGYPLLQIPKSRCLQQSKERRSIRSAGITAFMILSALRLLVNVVVQEMRVLCDVEKVLSDCSERLVSPWQSSFSATYLAFKRRVRRPPRTGRSNGAKAGAWTCRYFHPNARPEEQMTRTLYIPIC